MASIMEASTAIRHSASLKEFLNVSHVSTSL